MLSTYSSWCSINSSLGVWLLKKKKCNWLRIFLFQEIEKYRDLTKELLSIESATDFDMFFVDVEDLKFGLVDTCKRHVSTLLEHVLAEHRRENQK